MSKVPWQPIGSAAEILVAKLTNALNVLLSEYSEDELENEMLEIAEVASEGDAYCAEVDQAVARMHQRDMGDF